MNRSTTFLILVALFASPAAAAERTLLFTPDQTTIRWTLEATGHTVEGTFKLLSGRISWNPETGSAIGSIEIDARSARSGNDRRDRKMHEDILESDRYRTIVFEPSRIVGQVAAAGSSRVELHGSLFIHGSVHPLVLPADVRLEAGALAVTSSFSIPFVEWGMKDPSVFVIRVAKTVNIDLTARASIQEGDR